MNTLVILSAIIAVSMAGPLVEQAVSVTQDSLGSYDVKYAAGGISRAEHRDIDGHVNGGYSYIDPFGILRKVTYTAGEDGFHAISSDIPLPVTDTPEVAIAKAEHLTIHRAAELSQVPVVPIEFPKVAPATVLQIPPVSLIRIAPSTVPLVRLAAVPDSPEILEAEAKQFAALVDHSKHLTA